MVARSIDSILKMVHVMTKNFTDHRVLRIFSSVTSVSYLLREMAGGGERVFSLQKIANCLVNRVKQLSSTIFKLSQCKLASPILGHEGKVTSVTEQHYEKKSPNWCNLV